LVLREAGLGEAVSVKYRAFLSYAHADTRWAKWLHRSLEGFRLDKDLIGRETPLGPVPKTMRPIFRDREEISGGQNLTEAIVAALDASAALIVLCSPVAVGRPAVTEEVRLFRWRHPDRPVIPVIVGGKQPDNLPPALRFEVAADGTVTDRPAAAILGIDVRDAEAADGKNLGLAKIIAGLTGLGPDEIFRRTERTRRRSNRIWAGLAGAFFVLAVVAAGSAIYAWQQLKTNEAFLSATLRTTTDIVSMAVRQAEKYNVPRAATLELLTRAEGLFGNMARYGRPTPQLQYQKAWMLIQFARSYAVLGDTGKQLAHATEANRLLAGLTAQAPDDTIYQRDLSVAYSEIGDVLVAQGNLPEALKSFRDGLAIAERLAQSDPGNAGWQRDLSVSFDRVGDVLVAQGNLPEALKLFRDGLAIRERLAQSDPGNAGWQRDLSVSYNKIGDVLVEQGDLPEALKSFRDDLSIAEHLAQSNPGNAGWQRDLSVSYNNIGDVLVDQGNLPEALKSFRNGLSIREHLVQSDPGNAGWQRDLSVSFERVGDVLVAQGNLPEALKSFRAGLAIAERLAQSDPGNAGWQRDLSVSFNKIGNVLVAQGNLPEALKSFRAGLSIRDHLAQSDPGNAGWQRDLSVSYDKIGDVLVDQGHLPEALKSFRDGHEIFKRLAQSDPGNAGWQRDLSVSYAKLAFAFRKGGETAKALDALREGRAIMARMTTLSPDNAVWKRDLARFERQIAELAQ
jgi:tetratricopeptide (TPR) repeat protein